MEKPQENYETNSGRKALESLPDIALLLPDADPQIPPAGEKTYRRFQSSGRLDAGGSVWW